MYKIKAKKDRNKGGKKLNSPTPPLFSIITTTYNRTELLEECLNSLYGQNCKDYEHIIVDGNSTDGTFELVKSIIAKQEDKTIKIFQREPKGVYDAMNFGIQQASGRYIHLLNSDDYLADSEVLKKVKTLIMQNSYPQWIQGKRAQKLKSGKIARTSDAFGHQQAFISKTVHEKYGLYNTDYKYSADQEFYYRISDHIKPIRVTFDTVIQNHHAKSITMSGFTGTMKWIPDMTSILTKYIWKRVTGAENRT